MKILRLDEELFNSLLVIMDAGVKVLGLKACADSTAILGAVISDPVPQQEAEPHQEEPSETRTTKSVEEKEE